MATNEVDFAEFHRLLQSDGYGTDASDRETGVKQIDEYISRAEQGKISELWDYVSKALLRVLDQSAENCRGAALKTIEKFVRKLPKEDKYIVDLLPTLSRILGCSEFEEPSEEIRLTYVELLDVIITEYGDSLAPVANYFERILTRTMLDGNPQTKTASLYCVCNLAKSLPKKNFHSVSRSFVQPILVNLCDRRYKVRKAAVLAIGDCVRYGRSECLEEVANPLAQRLLDETCHVREAVIGVARDWLQHLPDGYSWWHKILPLLLSPLFDDFASVSEAAEKSWDQVGQLYLKENEGDEKLKSKLDFLEKSREHYPANVTRPNLGCRAIAQQTFPKLIDGICLELGDWQVDVRAQASSLLRAFLLNVEEEATQHIGKLLPAMYRTCKKEENKRVVRNVKIAAEYIGYFVPPETYCRLMIATFEESLSDGHLAVFSAVLRGSERSTLTPQLGTIEDFLQTPGVCQSYEKAYQQRLLECCNSIISVCGKGRDCIPIKLFKVIFTVLAMSSDESIEREAKRLLNILAEINSFADVTAYCTAYIPSLSDSLFHCESWSSDTAEAKILAACLVHMKGFLFSHNSFMEILIKTTNADTDPQLRLKLFTLLSRYFDEASCLAYTNSRNMYCFLAECVTPNLIWRAGKTAEAIRVAAVFCFRNLLLRCEKDQYWDMTCNKLVIDETIPLLISLANDNSKMARLYSVNALHCLVRMKKSRRLNLGKWVYEMQPVLLRRLDDGSNEVRIATLMVFAEIWKSVLSGSGGVSIKGHVRSLNTALLIYLDDSDASFQASVLDCLKVSAAVRPKLLLDMLTASRNNFKNQNSCDILTKHCRDMLSQVSRKTISSNCEPRGSNI